MTDLNFSIIIPHYNIPRLLQRCLDSIPRRDDLEIIVVDDNSSPDVVDFDHFPGHDRPDVTLILDKKGGGGGYARNRGLEVARGKWLLFADSDDFFTYCLNDMLDKYKDSEADIVFFNVNSCDTEFYTPAFRCGHVNKYIKQALTNRKLSEFNLRYLFGEPWCKLVKRAVIEENHIRFDCTPIHNDTTFSYLVGHFSSKVAIEPHAFYVETVREKSVSRSINEAKRFVRIEVFSRRDKFLRENLGIVDDVMAFHYNEIYQMVFKGEWKLAKKGIGIIHQYVPSYFSIWFHVLKRIPSHVKMILKKCVRYLLESIHLISRLENDYYVYKSLTNVKGGGKQSLIISFSCTPPEERRLCA